MLRRPPPFRPLEVPQIADELSPVLNLKTLLRQKWLLLSIALFGAAVILGVQALTYNRGNASIPPQQVQSIAIGVLGFTTHADDSLGGEIVDSISSEISARLGKSTIFGIVNMPNISSATSGTELAALSKVNGAYFYLAGALTHLNRGWEIRISTLDGATGQQTWTATYPLTDPTNANAVEALAMRAAGEARVALFANAKDRLASLSPEDATIWQLYLMATWSPGAEEDSVVWEHDRVALAERAVQLGPDFGLAHSVLADKLSYLANVDANFDTQENADRATFHANRTLALASDDPDAMFNWANRLWHIGDLDTSVLALQRVLELAPDHILARFLIDATPYTCAPIPQSTLDKLIKYDESITQDNPARWVLLTWLTQLHLNNDDLDSALPAGAASFAIYRTPDSTMRLAAAHLSGGEKENAQKLYQTITVGWPDFDPWHYAEVTIPRRCQNQPLKDEYVEFYSDLARLVSKPN